MIAWPIQSMTIRLCLIAIFWVAAISAVLWAFRLWLSRGSPSFTDVLRANLWLVWPMIASMELLVWQWPSPAYLPLIMALGFPAPMLIALYRYRAKVEDAA